MSEVSVGRWRFPWAALAVALGGALGALARHGVALWSGEAGFPWSTLLVNVVGCLLLGGLTVVVETSSVHRLVRPFLGVGVLGGFTTFSAYLVDAGGLLVAQRPVGALVYLLATVVLALAAVVCGAGLARRFVRRATPTAGEVERS
ncbi:fluoride efflux transporter FluC [Actinopolyspora mortivallis]|uniref:fluoride efflux transporter FluC n=1 Tax=Actinopolyspora mortivallis TaxID=33906 RepID=UPI000367FEE3|nr:CrcB family protein [Actinopolyspora mortivallis]